MRVLFVTNSLDVGGVETNVVRLARTLTERGHTLVVAAASGRLSDAARDAGATLVEIGATRGVAALWADALRLRRVVRDQRIDVVQSFSATASVLLQLAVRGPGAPPMVAAIMGLHGSPDESDRRVALRCWLTARGADVLVVPAPAIERMATRVRVRRSRLVGISVVGVEIPTPPPSDEAVAAVRAELGLGAHERMVLTIGRLEPRKSHELFVRAGAVIARERDDVRFFIAGDGELEGALRSEIDRLGLIDRVTLLGNRSDVTELLAAADVCVKPGVVEGFAGITVFEAQAVRTPVVAFHTEDVTIAIDHGRSGLIVPAGDIDSMATAITTILDDDELAQRLADGGFEKLTSTFEIGAVTDRLLSLYERVRAPS